MVHLVIAVDHLVGRLVVAVEQGLRRLGDHALHHPSHLEQGLAHPVEILVQSSFH
jgi:hypothetical protein